MRIGGRVLLLVLNLYLRIQIRLATFGANHSVTGRTQTSNRCSNPEASSLCIVISVSRVDVSDETIRFSISLRLAVDFFTCNVHKI